MNETESASEGVKYSDFIECETLYEWLNGDKEKQKEFQIIDVRDDDYGPYILGNLNYPAFEFNEIKMNEIIEKTKNTKYVIFHCALSQVRGPKCAEMYFKHRNANYANYPKQSVLVLRGGFRFFQQKYKESKFIVYPKKK